VTVGSADQALAQSFYRLLGLRLIVDGHFDRLSGAGVVFEHPPTDMPWLWREAPLRGPDGHQLCIFHVGENRLNPPLEDL
jgi:hypothetical protein